jgi:ABC-type multidrug transport system ATPase subunit
MMTLETQRLTPPPDLLSLHQARATYGPGALTLHIGPGLFALTGDEGRGKTTTLEMLAGSLPLVAGRRSGPHACYLDLRLLADGDLTPKSVWQRWQTQWPLWDDDLHTRLIQALGLRDHLEKSLDQLSTGSRRKVALVALLASGATVTCLDQPYAALDKASVNVVREFLQDMANHPSRAWVVADYEADPALPWAGQMRLP